MIIMNFPKIKIPWFVPPVGSSSSSSSIKMVNRVVVTNN